MPKVNRIPLTPLQAFKAEWENCKQCFLWKERYNRAVLCRGTYPCDVVFVAEAPGISEDIIGIPMIGPAGNLLNHIISKALPKAATYAITNLICCFPRDDNGEKYKEPPDEAVLACSGRLQDFVELCDPQLIVAVGKPAEDWLAPGYRDSIKFHKPLPVVFITHPAAILRTPQVQQGLAIQKAVITIRNGCEEYLKEG